MDLSGLLQGIERAPSFARLREAVTAERAQTGGRLPGLVIGVGDAAKAAATPVPAGGAAGRARLTVLAALASGGRCVVVASAMALAQGTLSPAELAASAGVLKPGDRLWPGPVPPPPPPPGSP